MMKRSGRSGCRHPLLRGIWVAVLIAVILCGLSLYQSKYRLEISRYEISSDKAADVIRFVQITDLHNSVFGGQNSDLIRAVSGQQPDFILMTGDMLNNYEIDSEIAVRLIRELSEIAPVYFSYGNHEKDYELRYGIDVTEMFEEAGARVLDGGCEDLVCQGVDIRLGGIYGYCLPGQDEGDGRPQETAFLEDFQKTDSLKILMCHMPVSWIEYGSLESWQVDVIFAGHAHGGQVRLPLIGGLYAPDQGWFVGREEGLYKSRDGKRTMVLSRGLGSSTVIPRFNNRPEIVVVDIVPE